MAKVIAPVEQLDLAIKLVNVAWMYADRGSFEYKILNEALTRLHMVAIGLEQA